MHEAIDALTSHGWDLITSPDYSVFAHQPRAEHLINMRRSALIAAALNDAGIAAAPAVYGFRYEDYDTWLAWIAAQRPPAL